MRLSGGYWKLHSIYEGLDKPENKEKATDSEWAAHIARLEEWKKAIPDSITARVALAESWMTYGRQARGHGYINTVSEENKRLFVERYENAYKELAASKDLKQKCPEWYVATLDVAIGQSWPREEFDRVFEAGFELEPTYYLLQREKLVYLLPQWFGHEGEVASFIKENSSRIQGDEGEIMYFLLLSTMQPVYRGRIFEQVKVPWDKAQLGYEKLKQHYALDRYRKNQYAFLTLFAKNNDISIMINAMDNVGDDWDPDVWGNKAFFDQMSKGTQSMKELAAKNGGKLFPD